MSSEPNNLCPVCGGSVSPTSIECPHCGERLIGSNTLPATADELRRELQELKDSRRRHNTLGFAFGLPGLLLQIGGAALAASQNFEPAFGLLLRLLGFILLAVGIYFVTIYKGRNGAWTLVSLLGCFGLLVILILKDYKLERIKAIEASLSQMNQRPD